MLAVSSFATFAGFWHVLLVSFKLSHRPNSTTRLQLRSLINSAIFWSLIGAILSIVWAALTTCESQYNVFIVSLFFGVLFGAITGVLGPRILVDSFFLHQKERASLFFIVAGPTSSALISAKSVWMNAYRWTTGLVGLAVILVFLFLHETSWDRTPGAVNPDPPSSFIVNRIATFLPGTKVTPRTSFSQTLKIARIPFLIAISPVCLVLSIFTLTNFGFYVAMNSLSPTFL
ncbi:uncharacterized protein EAE98_003050 [Botrytis deweyae]|uniref:Major facilitator superfamily (MFS) profile domain-containing protein n=1 Tax=Botrytis deweyae TaxID=2478750 RepID=A0ABQ7IVL2_9HELO|nr:uncharacterized protein EAE98_003050 [Botrytis deweyae]KAF7935005.1 hypothetical protein EAE98_003050 [Botrytis deweyae]